MPAPKAFASEPRSCMTLIVPRAMKTYKYMFPETLYSQTDKVS